MGFFQYLFGTNSDQYSREEYSVSAQEIRNLVARTKVKSLDASEEKVVEEALIAGRGVNNRLSVYQIDLILRALQHKKYISINDRKGIIRVFEGFFGNKQA